MALTRISGFVALGLFWLAFVNGVSAQVTVIETPTSDETSAFVFPVGPEEPFVGYRNWDIIINHDPSDYSPPLSQVKTYAIRTTRVGIDNINSVYIVSKVSATTGSTFVTISSAGPKFVNVGPVFMSPVPAERAGLVVVDPIFVTGDLNGPFEAHRFQLVAEGDLTGDVFLAPHFNRVSNLQVVVGGDIQSDLIEVSTSQNGIPGYIERLESTNGEIGAPNHMVYVLADGAFWLVRAGYINAYIGGVESTGAESFVQNVRRIETYTTGGHSGVFTGQIDAQRIEDTDVQANWMKFAGPMQGIIRLGYGFADNSTNPAAQNYIQVPTGGMQGQIIMQALGGADASNPWTRPVYVGGLTTVDDLNPKPNYAETTSQIGCASGPRAVGRVPYGTHFTDCFPVFTTDVNAFPTLAYGAIDDKTPIQIRNYGPVILPSFPNRAFKVERRIAGLPIADPTPWTNESCGFVESLDATGNVVLLTPSVALQAGFEYQVSQDLTGGVPRLKCDGVVLPDPPPPVALFGREFRFTICGPSLGDADSSGCVNFADNTSVPENWGSTACNKNGDADRNGVVNFADITKVLEQWLQAYCGGACTAFISQASGNAPSFMGVEGDVSALDATNTPAVALASMGYPSIEAFGDAIAAMTDEQRIFEMGRLQQLLEPQ
jgi:hypothetical protein